MTGLDLAGLGQGGGLCCALQGQAWLTSASLALSRGAILAGLDSAGLGQRGNLGSAHLGSAGLGWEAVSAGLDTGCKVE